MGMGVETIKRCQIVRGKGWEKQTWHIETK